MKKSSFLTLALFLVSMIFGNLVTLSADNAGNEISMRYSGAGILEERVPSDNVDVAYCGKRYIPMEKITLVDNLILVEIEEGIFETPAIYSDANGFYIENVKIADQGKCGYLQWQCQRCSQCNSLFYSCCSNCNRHISNTRDCK